MNRTSACVTVFIAGSIKIKHLDRKFKERIDKIIASGFDVVVGDADGADTAIQTDLFDRKRSFNPVPCNDGADVVGAISTRQQSYAGGSAMCQGSSAS